MTDEMKAPAADIWVGAQQPMDASTRLSSERTMLSHERTLMSWIRTATLLATFGFSTYKFFEFEAVGSSSPRPHQVVGPRGFAILMLGTGLTGLALAAVDNRRHRIHMRRSGLAAPMSYTTQVAVLTAILGFVALIAAILRWE